MNLVIYDTEIINAVPTPGVERDPRYTYCEGWHDKAGMGISVICAYETGTASPRVFLKDNADEFGNLMESTDAIVGFNNFHFDDRLLEANGFVVKPGKSIDLAALIWCAAGIPNGEHPRGLGLDDICQANKLPGKTGEGAFAPYDWQNGKIGKVVDYCLADVMCTLRLYRQLATAGGCKDPRNGEWLSVVVPR